MNVGIGWVSFITDRCFFSRYVSFILNANVSHRTLCLALSLVGMHSAAAAAASMWAWTNFSYSSFGVSVSNIF